jgi:hypothetical protein
MTRLSNWPVSPPLPPRGDFRTASGKSELEFDLGSKWASLGGGDRKPGLGLGPGRGLQVVCTCDRHIQTLPVQPLLDILSWQALPLTCQARKGAWRGVYIFLAKASLRVLLGWSNAESYRWSNCGRSDLGSRETGCFYPLL